jgi:hypothetical protein
VNRLVYKTLKQRSGVVVLTPEEKQFDGERK